MPDPEPKPSSAGRPHAGRRNLARLLARSPLLLSAAPLSTLASVAQTASAYGSANLSRKPGPPARSAPFTLTAALHDLRLHWEQAVRAHCSTATSLLNAGGIDKSIVEGLPLLSSGCPGDELDKWLRAVDDLLTGRLTWQDFKRDHHAVAMLLAELGSPLWPISPLTTFAAGVGPLQPYSGRRVLEVATDPHQPLGRYFVCAMLNAAAGDRIDAHILAPDMVRTIAHELQAKGYFEPTAGIRWSSEQVVQWWSNSLGLTL